MSGWDQQGDIEDAGNDGVIGGDQLGSSDSGPWYPRVQRKFNTGQPFNQDRTVFHLTEYTWEQNEQGEVRNQVAKVLTEDGWYEFQPFEVIPTDRLPHINGLDMVRQSVVANKLKQFEQWITAMIDFGNASGSPKDEQDQGHDGEYSQDGPHNVISHDRSVPTTGADETPEGTPADTTNNMKGHSANG
jgi:hypothetical protein